MKIGFRAGWSILATFSLVAIAAGQDLTPLKYNHPGLVVDLGVGLWAFPLPMDYDGDGDYDLVVSCPDRPYNGTYFFEKQIVFPQVDDLRSRAAIRKISQNRKSTGPNAA